MEIEKTKLLFFSLSLSFARTLFLNKGTEVTEDFGCVLENLIAFVVQAERASSKVEIYLRVTQT